MFLTCSQRACFMASGFSLTSLTFCSMRSMGCSTRREASRLNTNTPTPRIAQMNSVRIMLSSALNWANQRRFSTAQVCRQPAPAAVPHCGVLMLRAPSVTKQPSAPVLLLHVHAHRPEHAPRCVNKAAQLLSRWTPYGSFTIESPVSA